MERWRGRVAIVTGASSGIGAAITCLLAENGMRVVGVARRVERIQDLSKKCEGEIHAIYGDVTKEDDVLRVVKWTRDTLGGADVLVNNAGEFHLMKLTDIETEKLRHLWDLNVIGLSMFTREVFKDMRDRGINDGHIFNIGSYIGQTIVEFPGSYAASGVKHAIRVLTEGLRRELRDLQTKIRVTEISPSLVQTESIDNAMNPKQKEEFIEKYGSLLTPRDVADVLLYSLSTPPHVQIHEITMHPTGTRF